MTYVGERLDELPTSERFAVTAQDRRVFDALFTPRTIALVGASSDARKHTARPQRSLRQHGYAGKIIPINPRASEILGDRAYPSLLDVPEDVDHAFIMVPAAAVPEIIDQCVERRIPVATIYADGFAETGEEGRRAQEELVARARAGGVRLLGPNCSGVLSTSPSCALSVNAAIEQLDVTPGPLAVISQSGSMTGGLLSRGLGRGVGFSRVVSIGNECDLTVGELTDLLVDDPETGAILLFLESLRDADRLAVAARRAVAAGKPVIAYKLGRSDVGRTLAASHTGALAGTDEVADAFFTNHGIVRVDNIETLFELPTMLAGQKPRRRHRVAALSTTGGGAATVVDRLGTLGVEVVAPPTELIEKLAAQDIDIPAGPLTDLTHAGTKAEVYAAVLDALVESDHCDLVLAVAGSSAQFQPEVTVEPMIAAATRGKPLAAFLAPHATDGLTRLAEAGVAGYRTPESCADAIRAWSRWTPPVDPPAPDISSLNAFGKGLEECGGRPNELQAAAMFEALGIRTAKTTVITDVGAAGPLAGSLEFPVVAKVLSADVPHKTEAGGVVLGIDTDDELGAAVTAISERVRRFAPDAKIDGVLVQEMHKGLAEVIVGFRRDPEVGPVVVLGVGGIFAELYKDVAVRLAPVGADDAVAMIDEVTGLAAIRGYRGLPLGDVDAIVAAVVALSQLGASGAPRVDEAEINPLVVKARGQGAIAVDGLIIANRDHEDSVV